MKQVDEFLPFHFDVRSYEQRPRHRSCQEFLTDLRQQRVGENRVDHPSATFELGASARNELHHIIRIRERDSVVLLDALTDARELQRRAAATSKASATSKAAPVSTSMPRDPKLPPASATKTTSPATQEVQP